MSSPSKIFYVNTGKLSSAEAIGNKNEVTVENEKKVKSLAEHMLSLIVGLEKNYSITKRRLENEREVSSKPMEEPVPVENAEKGFFYELAYESYEDKVKGHEYARITLMPDMFRVRTNSTSRLQQHSTVFAELEAELERVHGFYYASRVSDALDDAMSQVGNARKYAIDGYLADEEAEAKVQAGKNIVGSAMKAISNWGTQADADSDYYYGEEEGI